MQSHLRERKPANRGKQQEPFPAQTRGDQPHKITNQNEVKDRKQEKKSRRDTRRVEFVLQSPHFSSGPFHYMGVQAHVSTLCEALLRSKSPWQSASIIKASMDLGMNHPNHLLSLKPSKPQQSQECYDRGLGPLTLDSYDAWRVGCNMVTYLVQNN